jgi:cytochrome c oxidase assembly protein Cox11
MEDKILYTVGNITYSGFTYNTRLKVEYKHTGIQYHIKNKYTCDKDIADSWIAKGKKVKVKQGNYFIYRIAIPNQNSWWYISNSGDSYTLNKASKYFKKIHSELSNNIVTIK